MKIQDLAKEVGKSPKDLIRFLMSVNIRVKSASSKLDPALVTRIRGMLATQKQTESQSELPLEVRTVVLTKSHTTVTDLAQLCNVRLPDLMKSILILGYSFNLNSEIDYEIAKRLLTPLNIILELDAPELESTSIRDQLDAMELESIVSDNAEIDERPPVVTIMGHVDHGKTRLLDVIRNSNVISREAGGITQHIGAYQVEVNGKRVTFLDTPGHAAFTTLRARGAQVTDIAILVVAADEGVKPQTIEALDHAKAAGVPVIVALNKMDKPGADPEQVKQQLATHDLVPEEWGGKTIYVQISAKMGTGIDELLDMILLQSELLELKGKVNGHAKGVVIESRLSRKKGPVATILVKSGTLSIGDNFVAGPIFGKIRALLNEWGKPVDKVTPGCPVEVLGLNEVPKPGDIVEVIASEKAARELATRNQTDIAPVAPRRLSLEALSQQVEFGELQSLQLVVKADVNGSLEAILALIDQMDHNDVVVSVLHSATGPVTENDVMLARASNGIIIAFGVEIREEAQSLADESDIQIKPYRIIYEIIDDLQKVLGGMFRVEYEKVQTASLVVRKLFSFSKVGSIAGSYVTSGTIHRHDMVRVLRNGEELFDGKLKSLKRFKDDVKEVANGFECGIVLDGFEGLAEGDQLIAYELKEKSRLKQG